MVSNEQTLLALLQSRLGSTAQILPGQLGKASVHVNSISHRDAIKVLLEADKKTGVSAITGIDLGGQIGLFTL
jgi:hypothetical protein